MGSNLILPLPLFLGPYRAKPVDGASLADLQRLLESDPDYFRIVQDAPPAPDEARKLCNDLPPGKEHPDKFLGGLFDERGAMRGVIDLIRDYPEPGHWYLGLLFLDPFARNRGDGARIMRDLTERLRGAGAKYLRLAVVERNSHAHRFWLRQGFSELRRLDYHPRPGVTLPVLDMGRSI